MKEDKKKYEKGTIGWHIELAKKVGYPEIEELNMTLAIGPFKKWAQEKGIFKSDKQSSTDIYNDTIKKFGFNNEKEYRVDLAKRRGCNNYSEYQKILYQNRKGIEYLNNLAVNKGYKDRKELLNSLAKRAGYIDNKNRKKEWHRNNQNNKGINFVWNENCPQYLGIEIGERRIAKKVLSLIVGEIIEEMPIGNPGFDFICRNEKLKDKNSQDTLKIDVKCAMLINNKYRFRISFNCVADYFIAIAFNGNDRRKLFPIYIWLFEKNDMVRKKIGRNSYEMKIFHDRENISISNDLNSVTYLEYFREYEKIYMIREKFSDLNKLIEE